MRKELTVERTDFSQSRVVAVIKKVNRHLALERARLKAEKRLFGEELSRTTDAQKRVELKVALQQNEAESRELEAGWRRSALYKRLASGTAGKAASDIVENRFYSEQTTAPTNRFQTEQRQNTNTKRQIIGYAATFNQWSLDLGGFTEKILPGAFAEALKISDCACLYNHNNNLLLGRERGRSLRLHENKQGLLFFCDTLPNDSLTDGVLQRIDRGDLSSCSFAFIPDIDLIIFPKKEGEPVLVIVEKVKEIIDVSIVLHPAYLSTSVWTKGEDRQASAPPVKEEYDAQADVDDWEEKEYGLFLLENARKKLIDWDFELAGKRLNRLKQFDPL